MATEVVHVLIAMYDGSRTYPGDFPNDLYGVNTCADGLEKYPTCPECGQRVTYVSEGVGGRAAHFRHCSDQLGGGSKRSECAGSSVAESDEHKAMKSIALSAVESRLESISVCNSATECDPATLLHSNSCGRVADAFVEFERRDWQLGKGLCIEVQHENKSKDVAQVTREYLAADCSVLWLRKADFNTNNPTPEKWQCDLGSEESIRGRVRRQIWPTENPASVITWRPDSSEICRPVSELEFPKIDRFASDEFIAELRAMLDEPKITARFCGEAVDMIAQRYKQQHEWYKLFRAPHAADFIPQTQGCETEVPAWFGPQVLAALTDQGLTDWEELFPATTAKQRISDLRDEFDLPAGKIPVSVPPTPASKLLAAHYSQSHSAGIEPPQTPFEDVQCHGCGHYWYGEASKPGYRFDYCPNCGESVDMVWNIQSGRVSKPPYWPNNRLTDIRAPLLGGETDE